MGWIKSNPKNLIAGIALATTVFTGHAQLVTSTGETIVNNELQHSQQSPAVAMDTSGRYVVVWESENQDGDGYGIYAEIYNADHTVSVPEFLVNTSVQTSDQRSPDVAITPDGNFCVVWQSYENGTSQGWDIYRKIYDITGAIVAARSRVNSVTSGNQMHAAVAAGDANFVVTYMSEVVGADESEIYGRVYLSSGSAVMSSTLIHSSLGNHLAHPDVAMSPTGEYVFVWQSDGEDGGGNGVFASLYDNTYTLVTGPDQVNTTTTQNQQEPRVAMDQNGEYMVVWSSFDQDGDHYGIYARRFDNSGTAAGSEFSINNTTSGSQDHVAIAVSREGGKYVISWTDDTNDGDHAGIYSRTMYSNGSFLANNTLVNTTTADYQMLSDVAVGTDSTEAVFVWQGGIRSGITTHTDTSDYGVYLQGFTVEDITPPTAVCQNITVYLDGAGSATITAGDLDGGSSDNIGIASMNASSTTFSCANIGVNIVTLTVYDDAGLSDNCAASVTVLDTVSPTAVCQDLTVYLDGSGNATITTGDVDAGSTDNCSTPALSLSQSSFTCADTGANTVTLTATDGSGNTSTCTSTVTVMDTVSPVASCQNLTVYLDGTGSATITGSDVDAGSTDNCSIASTSLDVSTFTCANIGANTVTLTVADGSGNTSTCTSTVTVADTTSPVASCQDITVYLDGSGSATITASDVDAGSTDNCSIASTGIDLSTFSCANIGANTVTLTVTDASGNTSICTSTVTVADTTSPTVSCQNITVYLDGSGNATITSGDVDAGSTDNCSTPALSLSQSSFTCANTGANTVTLTATDGSGNTSTCTSTVTVMDTISPVASCQNLTVYLDGTGSATITGSDVDAGSTDNCSIASTSLDVSTFTCANIGANTVTLTVADGSGNTSTCTSTVTVADTTSPVASCQDITVYLDGSGSATITASDVDAGSTDNCSIASTGIDLSTFSCANIGANTVTLTVTDASGNTSTCTSTVTVADTTSPTVSCQDITVYLDGAGNATITAGDVDAGSTDNCSTPALSLSQSSFTCADLGANIVTLTATDANGNTSSCTSTVTVADTTSPVVSCQDITVYLDGTGSATITAGDVNAGSSDNCSVASTTIDVSTFDCSMTGANTVTLTVTDGSGNTSTCTSTVTVADTTSPVASCQDITVYLDGSGSATITASDVDAGSTDNCSVASTTIDVSTFDCSMTGANTVTLTVTDASGNTSTCTSTVTVADTTSPTVSCQDITVYLDGSGNATITTGDVDAGSTDNCSTPALSLSQSSFTCADTGTNTVILTATDGSGNTSTCTSTVTVMDTISPVASCQNLTVYLDGTGSATITAGDVDAGSTDNCSVASTTIDVSTFDCSMTGANTVTLTVTDGSGNTSTCTSTVTVADTTSPVASCQDITVYLDGSGSATITASDVDAGSTDNCSVASTTIDVSTFDCSMTGANTVTLTVTDASGNTSTCTSTVTVADTTAPVASCQDITVYLDGSGSATITASDIDAGSTDNCSVASTSIDVSTFDCSMTGANTVVLTVTDPEGNISTCTSTVTVMDTLAPTFAICPSDISVPASDAGCSAAVTWVSPIASDNCSVALTSTHNSGDLFGQGTTVVTYTATDPSGNTATCSFNVTVTSDLAVTATGTDVLCNADSTGTATAVATGGATPYTYDWSTGESGAVENSLSAGMHTVTVTDSLGCIATTDVVINEPPALNLSATTVDETMGNDGSIDLTVTGGTSGYIYDWSNGATTEDINGLVGNMTYTVIVEDANGCMDTLDVFVDSKVGLIDIENDGQADLFIYPNPTVDGNFSVSFIGEWNGEVKIELVDSRGRLIYKEVTSEEVLNISLDQLETGTYFIRALDENDMELVRRLVKVSK